MNKKDILEIKRRFKKNECTFTKMCGCYVNAEKEIVLDFEETFLNLEDEEFYKYLEIAKKTLSGTIGNNLLELEFPLEAEFSGGTHQFLMGLRESKLKNSGLLHSFYQMVIDHYDYAGNYLILLFHDAYDVMTKTSDNRKLDESEEVYEYLLCAICPVSLSKPGLGYLEDENRIGPRIRDWVVESPDTGFLFPAFTDRSTDIHSIMFYTKDAKEPHVEFVESGLGCPPKRTATQQKNTFQSIISKAIDDEEKRTKVIMDIQDSLNQIIEEQDEFEGSSKEDIFLTNDTIQEILTESGIPEEIVTKIEAAYEENFGDTPPVVEHLIDSKILAESAKRKREQALEEQIQDMTAVSASKGSDTLEDDMAHADTETVLEGSEDEDDALSYDVILRVKPQKISQITSQVIDGKKCIIIPLDENEQANVNGIADLI